jgi:hypothetical protein
MASGGRVQRPGRAGNYADTGGIHHRAAERRLGARAGHKERRRDRADRHRRLGLLLTHWRREAEPTVLVCGFVESTSRRGGARGDASAVDRSPERPHRRRSRWPGRWNLSNPGASSKQDRWGAEGEDCTTRRAEGDRTPTAPPRSPPPHAPHLRRRRAAGQPAARRRGPGIGAITSRIPAGRTTPCPAIHARAWSSRSAPARGPSSSPRR